MEDLKEEVLNYMDITTNVSNQEINIDRNNILNVKLRMLEKSIKENNISYGLDIVRQLLNDTTFNIKPEIKNYRESFDCPSTENIDLANSNIRLNIYTFGQFIMILDGKPIVFRRKVQKRPLDLLKTMITLGGREISKTHLTELLWPDSAGDASVSVINTTIYRLRELIGKEAIITENGCISLNPQYCWIDFWEFESILNKSKNPSEIKQEQIEKILDIYQEGGFLSGDEYGWMLAKRDKLKQKLLYILNNYCHWLIKNKQLNTVNTILKECIKLDNLNEGYYLILMRCQISQNKISDAIHTYRQCKQTFKNQLGIFPSSQFEKVYQTIVSQFNISGVMNLN